MECVWSVWVVCSGCGCSVRMGSLECEGGRR